MHALGSSPLALSFLLWVWVLGGHSTAIATPANLPDAAQLQKICRDLSGQTISGATIIKTENIEPSPLTGNQGLCRISGTQAPFLDIQVVVPELWSGRFFQPGGGGLDGRIPSALTLDQDGQLAASLRAHLTPFLFSTPR